MGNFQLNDPCQLGRYEFGNQVERVDFISDLHLAENRPHTHSLFKNFLKQSTADALVILGDLFEAWVGDDALSEDSYESECARLIQEFSAKKATLIMHGNRDFLLGSKFAAATGSTLITDPTLFSAWGDKCLCTHGDAWCLEDTDYLNFRTQVRSPRWQQQFLSLPLVDRRLIAQGMREGSRNHQQEHRHYFDVDKPLALAWLTKLNCKVLVHGHTHRPTSDQVSDTCTRHVLTDWDADQIPYRAEVLSWTREGYDRQTLS
jgi:UDP-2,3-diacylglucosamine hydrolase